MSRRRQWRSDRLTKTTADAVRYDQSSAQESTHCRCGKVSHPSRKSAKRHLRRLAGQGGYGGKIYRCRVTGAWHVGWSQRDRGPLIIDAFYLALMELAGLPLRRGFAREKV